MQGPETPAASLNPHGFQGLVMPSPEALGIVTASVTATADLDWNELGGRLRQLGAVGFHLDQVAGGAWRATLLVPDGASATPRRVEAVAASEASAVADVLAQAGSR